VDTYDGIHLRPLTIYCNMSADAAWNRLANSILQLEEQVDLLRKHVDTLVDDPLFDGLSAVTRGVEGAANECKQSFEDYKQKK
jgi:hypothetical protein